MKNKLYTTAVIAILFASATSLPAEAQRSVDRSTPMLDDRLQASDDETENAAIFVKIEGVDGESESAAPGVEPDEIDVQNTAANEGLEPDEIDARNNVGSETRRTIRRPNGSKTAQQRRRSQSAPAVDEGLTVDADGDGVALLLPAVQSAREAGRSAPEENAIVPHWTTLDDLPNTPESAADSLPTEEVTLGYTEVEWTYSQTEEASGDGDLEVDAASELNMLRSAPRESDADAATTTRVRRGMQELKN